MRHNIDHKILEFFDHLQRTTKIGIQNVSLVQDNQYIEEYQVMFANQMFSIWFNKLSKDICPYGWEPAGLGGFKHVFTQGFDEDSI